MLIFQDENAANARLVRLTAEVFAHNGASMRVLEKNGFVREGLLRKHVVKDAQFIDAVLYSLVR